MQEGDVGGGALGDMGSSFCHRKMTIQSAEGFPGVRPSASEDGTELRVNDCHFFRLKHFRRSAGENHPGSAMNTVGYGKVGRHFHGAAPSTTTENPVVRGRGRCNPRPLSAMLTPRSRDRMTVKALRRGFDWATQLRRL